MAPLFRPLTRSCIVVFRGNAIHMITHYRFLWPLSTPHQLAHPCGPAPFPFIDQTRTMTVLSRPYSDSGVVNADVFASFTEHSHSSCLLLLNGVKVCGVWYLDSMGSLRSGYGPSVLMDNVGQPFGLLLSTSNTECVGMILSRAAFNWVPVLAPRRDKPSWAVSASSGTVNLPCSLRPALTHFPLYPPTCPSSWSRRSAPSRSSSLPSTTWGMRT
jgi:hypothetical protein